MESLNNIRGMLELLLRPAFCVRDGNIQAVNQAASTYLLSVGTNIQDILATGSEEYAAFSQGCLYLNLNISGTSFGASVTDMDGWHIFVLEQESDQAELRSMALAARELREPLASVMTVADRLFPMVSEEQEAQDQIARINRGLFQMLRVISNMSDAARYSQDNGSFQELRNISAIFEECFAQAAELVAHGGLTLKYEGLKERVLGLADQEMLERAVYNILSNSMKFTPKGGTIYARLTRQGSRLYLTVQDSGPGIDGRVKPNVYSRYLRQPGVEDGRFGIGLGMVLIRSAAAAHGGTVLLEHPEGCGLRLTMTMAVRQANGATLRSGILKVDYAGERNHGLIELSDSLPPDLYEQDNIS